jgi:hypothetical protein
VTLKPGAELFTFSVGPLDKSWKPFGYDADQQSCHTRAVEVDPKEEEGGSSEAQEEREKCLVMCDAFMCCVMLCATGVAKPKKYERQTIPIMGCPMLVQTTNHVKIFAEVSVDISTTLYHNHLA